MKIRLAIAALWALSLVLVFLMTKDSATSAAREQARQAAEGDSALASAAGSATRGALRPVTSQIRTVEKIVVVDRAAADPSASAFAEGARTPDIDVGAIERQLPGALSEGGDLMAKNLIVAEMLAGLTTENVHAALAAFEGAERNQLNDHNFRMFMFAWGKIDGKAATEYAFFNEDGKKVHYAGSSAIKAWGETDPLAAKAFIDAVEDDNRSKPYMIDALVRGWADKDLNGASEYVSSLSQTDGRKKLIEHLAQEHIKQNGSQSALAWADRVASFNSDDPQFAANVVSDAAFYAARDNPMATRDWLENNLDSPYLNSRIFEEVADEMMEIDPAAASRFMDTHFEDDRVNGKVIAEMTEEWARMDPAAAAQWVNQYLGHEKINSEVVHELAGEWADSDPDAAISWVASLDNEQLKRKGLASAVDHWARKQPAEVGAWLNQQTQRGELYDPAIEVYVNRIVRESPIAALSWAQQIQNNGSRERTSVRAGQALFRTDEDAVLAWLPSSGLSERAQNAILNPPKNQTYDRRRR